MAEPGLGPIVQLDPMLPRPAVNTVSEDDRLLRRIETRMHELDRTITGILGRYQGGRPAASVRHFPELEQARDQRDASWEELQAVLRRDEGREREQDLLDTPGSQRSQDVEERRLLAQNQLAMVACLYELATGSEPDVAALDSGAELVAAIPYRDLPIAKRPASHYYRFAFALHRSRLATGSRREQLLEEARRQRDLLRREFPDSHLAITADKLLTHGDFDLSALDAVEPLDLLGTVPGP